MPNIDLSTSARLFRNGNEIFQIYKGDDLIWQKINPYIINVVIAGTGEVATEHSCAVTAFGNTTPIISYQWRLNGNDIPGATGSSYTPSPVDTGVLTCLGMAYNEHGHAKVISNPIDLLG